MNSHNKRTLANVMLNDYFRTETIILYAYHHQSKTLPSRKTDDKINSLHALTHFSCQNIFYSNKYFGYYARFSFNFEFLVLLI